MKNILQVVVEEEYQRCLDHLNSLLDKYQITEGNRRIRYDMMIENRIKSARFGMKCLDIEEDEEVLIEAERLMNYKGDKNEK